MTVGVSAGYDLGRQARTFEAIATVVVVLLVLNLLRLVGVVSVGFALWAGIADGDLATAGPAVEDFLRSLVGVLPTVIYLGGVWAARGLFARIGGGELFSAANSRSLADIGAALLWGAGAAMAVVPFLRSLIDGDYYGFGRVNIEQETLVLAVIGGAILILGRMMARATALQSELDEII